MAVTGEAVVDSMNQEDKGVAIMIQWNVVHPGIFTMEHKSVKRIFCEGPEKDAAKDQNYIRTQIVAGFQHL